MEDKQQEILMKLQAMKFQIDRLVSDAESEKEFRKLRNAEIEKRLREIEEWKSELNGKLIVIGIIGTILASIIVKVITL